MVLYSVRALGLAAWLLLAFAGAGALLAQAPPAAVKGEDLIATQLGDFPLIISAPHGGLAQVPGVPPRKGEGLPKGPTGFVAGRDTGTDQLALATAKAVEARRGKKPYVVIARFHRKFIDANRPAGIAYEDPDAKPAYDAYHGALNEYCKDVQEKFGRGLLIDIHGQGSVKDTVFRGTQNGQTVELLVRRYGLQAHLGPRSLFGLFAAKGWTVFPEIDSKAKERAGFTGGYIVRTYGSHQGYGIDAVQLEFGGDYRNKKAIPATAATLAEAIDAYAKLYLFDAPAAKQP